MDTGQFINSYEENLYNTLKLIFKIYDPWKFIVGGSSALYLQGIKYKVPKDLDLFSFTDKDVFLKFVSDHNIKKPRTPIKIDWGFFPQVSSYSKPIKIKFYDLTLLVQPFDEIIQFKKEYEKIPNMLAKNRSKHKSDLNTLKDYLFNLSNKEKVKLAKMINYI